MSNIAIYFIKAVSKSILYFNMTIVALVDFNYPNVQDVEINNILLP